MISRTRICFHMHSIQKCTGNSWRQTRGTGTWKFLIHRHSCSACGKMKSSKSKLTKVRHSSRSEEHTSELQSRGHLVCRLLLEKKNKPARTGKGTGRQK